MGQDRAPPPSIYCSGPFRALGQRRCRGCDSLFINQRRLTWLEANKEAIGRRRSLRKKRSRQSPLPQAKRVRRRDGSRTSRPAKRNRNGSRKTWRQSLRRSALGRAVEKVFLGLQTKFSKAAGSFRAQRREGPHCASEKRPRTFVSALQSIAAAE